MTALSANSPATLNVTSLAAASAPAGLSLPAQVAERFLARIAADDAVSSASTEVIRSLLSQDASPSRDSIFRAVQIAHSTASTAAADSRPAFLAIS